MALSFYHLECVALLQQPLDGAREGIFQIAVRTDGIVECNDGTVPYIAFYIGKHILAIEAEAIVARHKVPHYNLVALAELDILLVAYDAMRRTEKVAMQKGVGTIHIVNVLLRVGKKPLLVVEGVYYIVDCYKDFYNTLFQILISVY